jgi:L-cystine transport system substrate-binding protein
MLKMKELTLFILIILTSIGAIACSKGSRQGNQAGVRTITVAHSAASRPMNYINDAGQSDGYEVAVFKEIDALLPQYEFVFVPIPDDSDLLIGVETGKYDVGIKAAWITAERLAKYIFPKHPNGASSIGLAIRAADRNRYVNLEAFAREGGRLIPISPISAQYSVIVDFNKQHPNTPIELIPSESFDVSNPYQWVLEGRYDGYFATKTSYERTIVEEGSPYHQYNKDLGYFVYRSLPVWPLFNRGQQELADAYDEAFLTLLGNGKINAIMFEYLDENTFSYILEEEYQYLKQ